MNSGRPRFCLDESSMVELDPDRNDFASILEDFALLVNECHNDGQGTVKPPSFFDAPFWQEIFEGNRLDREQRGLLMQVVQRSADLSAEVMASLPVVQVPGETTCRASQAAAYAYVRHGERHAVGCLCVPESNGSCGYLDVSPPNGETRQVHFICDSVGKLSFYRQVPKVDDMTEEQFIRHGRLAFPALYLHPDLQFNQFQTRYRESRLLVTDHLIFLNDDFQEIFVRLKGDPQSVAQEARVDLSGDGPLERRNSKKRKLRTVVVEGDSIYCSWHTKLFRNRDRIYFRPAAPDIVGDRLMIGIFHKHL